MMDYAADAFAHVCALGRITEAALRAACEADDAGHEWFTGHHLSRAHDAAERALRIAAGGRHG